ncbi:hypothetical protein HMPREF1978_00219 [Actinomyces graevenitzii F0530]|uniref:Uncharacterized protein n=1 Tax=Actinomyces graevenitzii F0530 TaxID=1321817 RepID=U1PR59_9ACTO|nr:hypothetical protein HMPREF1978_00219 [Actinomyces graevenitzii F0530]
MTGLPDPTGVSRHRLARLLLLHLLGATPARQGLAPPCTTSTATASNAAA